MICQLRLWIELLKNAYYVQGKNAELETLPNIDINIKCGNSLISRFKLDEDLKSVTPYFEKKILEYKSWVADYKNENNKDKKQGIRQLIDDLRKGFISKITDRNPLKIKLDKLSNAFLNKYVNEKLFSQELTEAQKKDKIKLDKEIEKLNSELESYKANPIHKQAFEWRFEFPEVLDDNGNYKGFDVVIGNPPYISIQDLKQFDNNAADYYRNNFETTKNGNFDIYIPFIEIVKSITNKHSISTYILPSKFFTTDYGKGIRDYLLKNKLVSEIADFGHDQVFDSATTYTCIIFLEKTQRDFFMFFKTKPCEILEIEHVKGKKYYAELEDANWILDNNTIGQLINKISIGTSRLIDIPCEISRGSSTGDDGVFILKKDGEKYINGYGEIVDVENTFLINPIFATDFSRYLFREGKKMKLIFPYEYLNSSFSLIEESTIQKESPKLFEYLISNIDRLKKRKQFSKWYGYSAARNLKIHGNSDILIPLLADKGLFTITPRNDTYTLMAGGGFSISIKTEFVDKHYLLALLNSKLLFFALARESNKFRGGYITCTKQYFENIPIKIIDTALQLPFINLVNKILAAKKASPQADTSAWEKEIDALVYQLYGLMEADVNIIESKK